jgi:hypothetical protein
VDACQARAAAAPAGPYRRCGQVAVTQGLSKNHQLLFRCACCGKSYSAAAAQVHEPRVGWKVSPKAAAAAAQPPTCLYAAMLRAFWADIWSEKASMCKVHIHSHACAARRGARSAGRGMCAGTGTGCCPLAPPMALVNRRVKERSKAVVPSFLHFQVRPARPIRYRMMQQSIHRKLFHRAEWDCRYRACPSTLRHSNSRGQAKPFGSQVKCGDSGG